MVAQTYMRSSLDGFYAFRPLVRHARRRTTAPVQRGRDGADGFKEQLPGKQFMRLTFAGRNSRQVAGDPALVRRGCCARHTRTFLSKDEKEHLLHRPYGTICA